MITIAAGVCLGIVAAIYLLNWLGQVAAWREERRERRAYRKMMRAFQMTEQERELAATDRVIGIGFAVCIFILAMAYFIIPH